MSGEGCGPTVEPMIECVVRMFVTQLRMASLMVPSSVVDPLSAGITVAPKFHAEDIQGLALHIHAAHVNDAFQVYIFASVYFLRVCILRDVHSPSHVNLRCAFFAPLVVSATADAGLVNLVVRSHVRAVPSSSSCGDVDVNLLH